MTVHLIINKNLRKCLFNPLNKDAGTIDWINWDRVITRLAEKVESSSTITQISVARTKS